MSIALTDMPVTLTADLPYTPRPHGLISAITPVLGDNNERWIFGGATVEAVCGSVGTTTAICYTGTEFPDKETFGNDWQDLQPLIAFAMHECSTIGKPLTERATDAAKALTIGEQTALETHFATVALADTALATVAADGATAEDVLAAAEDLVGYDAGKVIHLAPSTIVRLGGRVQVVDGELRTKNGTLIVSGLGYAEGGLTAGSALVTGPVLGASGTLETSETVLDKATNVVYALAEKPWVLGYACGATLINPAVAP